MSICGIDHVLEPFGLPRLARERFSPRNLFDRNGKLLLAKGQVITPFIWDLLHRREVYTQRVQWKEWECRVFSEHLYWDTVNKLKELYACPSCVNGERLNQTIGIVNELLGEFADGSKVYFDFKALRAYDKYTYIHSLNVAILSALIGREMGFCEAALRQLTLGALLHDIGILGVPGEIANKTEGLSTEEIALIRRHPSIGRDMLKQAVLPWEVLAPVYQHHERWNGTGYPQGLSQQAIHLNARITAIADVFDAVTANRPLRDGVLPYHAFELVVNSKFSDFDPDVVAVFAKAITIYPRNSTVRLNTGETGVVISIPGWYPTRPKVQILYDAGGQPVKERLVVNLLERLTSFIVAVEYGRPQSA